MMGRRLLILGAAALVATGPQLSRASEGLPPAADGGAPALSIPVRPTEIPGIGAAPVVLDLRAVLDRAESGNLDLRAARARAEAAEGDRGSARGRWWPSLTVGALSRHTEGTLQGTFGDIGSSNFDTALASAILRWELNPAATHFRSRAAGDEADAARAGADAVRLEARVAAATGYVELLGAAALAGVARKTMDDASEFLKVVRALEGQGLGPEVDVERARSEIAVRGRSLAEAEEAFRLASVRLAEILDLDPGAMILPRDTLIAPPRLPSTEDAETLVARALEIRPEPKAAAGEAAAARSLLAALRWDAYGPGVSMEAQRGWLGTSFPEAGNQSIYSARLGWTFNVSQAPALRAARVRLTAAEFELERARQRVRAEVMTAREAVGLARERLELAREGLEAAESAARISQARFAGGMGSALEILQAQDAAAAARANAVSVLVEAHRSVFELRRALGVALDAP